LIVICAPAICRFEPVRNQVLMKPLSHVLKQESPILLAREVVRRVRKKWDRKRILKMMEQPPRLAVRHVGYHKFQAGDFAEPTRTCITGFADEICRGRFPFLGYGTVDLGFPPAWNRDFVSGTDWPQISIALKACIRHDGSDVKAPYELSRLQFLPVLGKAYRFTAEERYREAARNLLSDWIVQNPVSVGVNWTVAMEAALRAISICFLLDLLCPIRPDEQQWLQQVTNSLWQHLVFIEAHNEFSHLVRSNHYLSNIVGLYCLSVFLEGKGMQARGRLYARRIEREILHQVYEDGGDHESSTGYHVLVTQMFTSALLLMRARGTNPSPKYSKKLRAMYRFLLESSNRDGELPMVGDCDDGRVELLLDDLGQMLTLPVEQRNSLRVSNLVGIGSALFDRTEGTFEDAKWYGLNIISQTDTGPLRSNVVVFPQSGLAVARNGEAEVLFYAMPNGIHGKGSHTHNDKLSIVLRIAGQELLCDSGTCCYTRDACTRNRFRITAAHNTVIVDNLEQNRILFDTNALFIISDDAAVSPIELLSTEQAPVIRASHFGYRNLGVTHTRTVRLPESKVAILEDLLLGGGKHTLEVNFHLDPAWEIVSLENRGRSVHCQASGKRVVQLEFTAPTDLSAEKVPTQISRTFGSWIPASKIRLLGEAALPCTLTTRISWQ